MGEYDFVPSGLSLSTATADMVHWQWTGSDYNPQRGCNDAEGGPPDGNNGNQNARADRTNVVELQNMAHNYPFGGLNNEATIMPILQMDPVTAAEVTFFTNEDGTEADLARVKKMAFLDHKQELADAGQLCLTQVELNNIKNENQRDTNPRNCAKVNTIHPYFDGGLQSTTARSGNYGFFSSRNNNFSNRDQTMGICVNQATCTFTEAVGNSVDDFVAPINPLVPSESIIDGDLIESDPVDNDGFGSGFKFGCTQEEPSTAASDIEIVGIVFGSVLAGGAVALIGMQVYKGRQGNDGVGAKSVEMPKFTAGRTSKKGSSNWLATSSPKSNAVL